MKREKNNSFHFGEGIRQWRRKWIFKERVSNFFLDFPAFGPSDPDGLRDKVALRCKGYAWTLVLRSFDKLWKVGVFSYLI